MSTDSLKELYKRVYCENVEKYFNDSPEGYEYSKELFGSIDDYEAYIKEVKADRVAIDNIDITSRAYDHFTDMCLFKSGIDTLRFLKHIDEEHLIEHIVKTSQGDSSSYRGFFLLIKELDRTIKYSAYLPEIISAEDKKAAVDKLFRIAELLDLHKVGYAYDVARKYLMMLLYEDNASTFINPSFIDAGDYSVLKILLHEAKKIINTAVTGKGSLNKSEVDVTIESLCDLLGQLIAKSDTYSEETDVMSMIAESL